MGFTLVSGDDSQRLETLVHSLVMAKSGVTLDAVWRIGTSLPDVQKSTAYGNPALKVKRRNGKLDLMAAVPTNKSAEPGTLMVRVNREERSTLIEEAPEIYYAPDHYLAYDAVLVRLARLTPESLPDLLAMAHSFVTRKKPAR